MRGAGINCVNVERALVVSDCGSWTTELVCVIACSVGEGRSVLMRNVFGVQLNGTNVGGSWLVGRRGTIDPFASRNSVRPVVQSGPRHTPSSVFGSVLGAVWCWCANEILLSSCCVTMHEAPNGNGGRRGFVPRRSSSGVCGELRELMREFRMEAIALCR